MLTYINSYLAKSGIGILPLDSQWVVRITRVEPLAFEVEYLFKGLLAVCPQVEESIFVILIFAAFEEEAFLLVPASESCTSRQPKCNEQYS